MKLKFKKVKEDQTFEIEGPNLLLIKVALLEHCGYDVALHLFQKKIESSLLFYCPTDRDRDILVKRIYDRYVKENLIELYNAMKSIKEV